MAKIIDITEKLNFEEKPKLKVKEIEVEVNNSAVDILQIMPKIENPSNSDLISIYETLFEKSERKKVEALKLNIRDFTSFISEAIVLVTGSEDEQGETVTPATT